MNAHADKTEDNKKATGINSSSKNTRQTKKISIFEDNRPEVIALKKLQQSASRQSKATQLKQSGGEETIPAKQVIQKKTNKTGLPDNLKTGIENLSGYAMDDVRVHYNSNKPSQLQAHAYAQGTDIHIASGQEKHLAHEAWHVVQQKQGRVKPTLQLKGNIGVNTDTNLEHEADVMGALAMKAYNKQVNPHKNTLFNSKNTLQKVAVIQRMDFNKPDWSKVKSVEVKGMNPGVVIVTFEDNDVFVLKGEQLNPGREALAGKLALEVGLSAPELRRVEMDEIKEILTNEAIKTYFGRILGLPLMLMKSLPGYDLGNIENEKKEFDPKELEHMAVEIGKWLAFDVFIGESDRFQSLGKDDLKLNAGNLIFDDKTKTVSGIDQSAATLKPQTLEKESNTIFQQILKLDKKLAFQLAKAVLAVLVPKPKGELEKVFLIQFGEQLLKSANEQFERMKNMNPEKVKAIAKSVKTEPDMGAFDPAVEAILANISFLNKK